MRCILNLGEFLGGRELGSGFSLERIVFFKLAFRYVHQRVARPNQRNHRVNPCTAKWSWLSKGNKRKSHLDHYYFEQNIIYVCRSHNLHTHPSSLAFAAQLIFPATGHRHIREPSGTARFLQLPFGSSNNYYRNQLCPCCSMSNFSLHLFSDLNE